MAHYRPVLWGELRHFSQHEFLCACCGEEKMQMPFVEALDRLRSALAEPIVITSGYRCPDYNERISSTGRNGPHTTGYAADVGIALTSAYNLVDLAMDEGFAGIGLKQHGGIETRFVHLDMLNPKGNRIRPTIWTYSQ